jgi:hypothetical protein
MVMPIVKPMAERAQATLTPVALKVKDYLPETAKNLVDQLQDQVKGKSLSEVRDLAVNATRKNLLNVNKDDQPSLRDLTMEVKEATKSGVLMKNALELSEKAAGTCFGEIEIPKDAGPLRRVYNLSAKVTRGVMDYSTLQLNKAKDATRDMVNLRMDQTRRNMYNAMDMVRQQMSPIMTRIGALPVIPPFIYRMIRGEPSSQTSNLSTSKSTAKTGGAAKIAPGGTTSVKLEVSTKPTSSTIGNTNAQGLGKWGEAGMGMTTTGGEVKSAEHQESIIPPTEDPASKKKKAKDVK